MILYIGTFFLGFIIDKYEQKNKLVKYLFILWLYIFFCFGYMTGSDWRSYEIFYMNSSFNFQNATTEKGFYFLFNFLHQFIDDFFITLGLLKCFYLASLIFLLKEISRSWLSIISILMPLCLNFMLIDNPLRFMVALIFINIGLFYSFKNNLRKGIIISMIAPLFHMTSVVIIPMLLVFRYHKVMYGLKSRYYILLYLTILIIFSFPASFMSLINIIVPFLHNLGSKSYQSYIQSLKLNSFITMGSFVNVFFFFILVKNKPVFSNYKYGEEIFSASILSLILFRITLIIPNGFRLIMPLQYFLGISYFYLIKKNKIYNYLLITYLLIILSKSLLQSYVYLPYSNSIPYIMTTHKTYNERDQNNINEYYKRTGKRISRDD